MPKSADRKTAITSGERALGWSDADVPLPVDATSRDGVRFDASGMLWRLRTPTSNFSFDFDAMRLEVFEAPRSLRAVILWYLANKAGDSAYNAFDRLRHFFDYFDGSIRVISSEHVLNYWDSLAANRKWYLGSLASVFRHWQRLGYPGIDPNAVRLLDTMTIPGNSKGDAVLTMDPDEGPFTDAERGAIIAALASACEKRTITREEYVLGLLLSALAPRPIQLSALKVCDLTVTKGTDGIETYTLRVPRAKQRDRGIRELFRVRPLYEDIGRVVLDHANIIRGAFDGVLDDPDEAPMFLADEDTLDFATGFEFHASAEVIGARVRELFRKLDVKSERTGRPIKVFATRFRRTLGTNAAREGFSPLVIADLLDHSDTQNVGVYTEATPEIIERIDRAIALRMAPLAQAFAGRVVKDWREAERGDDPSSRIMAPQPDPQGRPVGNCGKHGDCRLPCPIACYTCLHFHAVSDGPHEVVLAYLIAEREKHMKTDRRIAQVNDRTIFAVAQVVLTCQRMREAGQEGSDG